MSLKTETREYTTVQTGTIDVVTCDVCGREIGAFRGQDRLGAPPSKKMTWYSVNMINEKGDRLRRTDVCSGDCLCEYARMAETLEMAEARA